jgi:hypothetical protein
MVVAIAALVEGGAKQGMKILRFVKEMQKLGDCAV